MRLSTPRVCLRSGTEVGRYEIISTLGNGGMADVYLARLRGVEGFERRVALKRLRPGFAQKSTHRKIFIGEANMLAALSHANVVSVHELAFDGESYLYTMEFVSGVDLRELVRRSWSRGVDIPEAQVLRVVVETAAGLHAAHELGIVHRDVSPGNILVSRDGCVKLIDFGLAVSPDNATAGMAEVSDHRVSYVSPEQCCGEPVDPRSDIFALGVVLYELTVGREVFGGEARAALFDAIVDGRAPVPSDLVPGYPIELEAIVLRCLQRDPEHRYQTAEALQVDLERYAQHTALSLSSSELARLVRAAVPDDVPFDDRDRCARPIAPAGAVAISACAPPASKAVRQNAP